MQENVDRLLSVATGDRKRNNDLNILSKGNLGCILGRTLSQ